MIRTATMPAPAAFRATAALDADDAGLPTWLYRSEAFAEDLLGADDAPAASAAARPVSTLLYAATLAAALLALLPAAGLLA